MPNPLASGDFNGDGMLDLAVAERLSNVILLEGVGAAFNVKEILLERSPSALTSGDFDGEGLLDFVVLNGESDSLTYVRRGLLDTTSRSFPTGL